MLQACQIDIIREKGHEYFISTLTDVRSSNGVRALAAFNLTCLVDNYSKGQVCIKDRFFYKIKIIVFPTLGGAITSNVSCC